MNLPRNFLEGEVVLGFTEVFSLVPERNRGGCKENVSKTG